MKAGKVHDNLLIVTPDVVSEGNRSDEYNMQKKKTPKKQPGGCKDMCFLHTN